MMGRNCHVREDVALDVDPGGHFGELDALGGAAEHAAFGDVEDVLPGFAGAARR